MFVRIAALLLLPALCFAIDLASLKPQGYVSDFARVVDPASKTALEDYCARVEKATGVQMAFVTITSTDGEPIDDLANDLFRRWGIGAKGKDEGLLLLLAVQERRSRLEVGRGLEEYITDGTAGGLLREMRTSLRANEYGTALLTAANALASRIAQAKSVQIPETSPQLRRRPPPETSAGDLPWPLLLGAAFFLFLMMSGGGRGRGGGAGGFLPGLILGTLMGGNRGYAGGRGGGFGGYDSGGGGFGGFGGGDSGGGGASSDW